VLVQDAQLGGLSSSSSSTLFAMDRNVLTRAAVYSWASCFFCV